MHKPNESSNKTFCEEYLFFPSAFLYKSCFQKKCFHLSASSLKPEHGKEHNTDKILDKLLPPLLLPSTSSNLPLSLISLPPPGECHCHEFMMCRMAGGAGLGKAWQAAGLSSAFHRQTLEKMSRFLSHMADTIVISGELMRRQLFCLLLNTESQLNKTSRNESCRDVDQFSSTWTQHTDKKNTPPF